VRDVIGSELRVNDILRRCQGGRMLQDGNPGRRYRKEKGFCE
jgi:hypothetical protein